MARPAHFQCCGAPSEGARALDRLDAAPTIPTPALRGEQQPLPAFTRTPALPQPCLTRARSLPASSQRRLAGALEPSGAPGRELRRRVPIPRHLLPGLRLRTHRANRWFLARQSRFLPAARPTQAALPARSSSARPQPPAPSPPSRGTRRVRSQRRRALSLSGAGARGIARPFPPATR